MCTVWTPSDVAAVLFVLTMSLVVGGVAVTFCRLMTKGL